jgi:RHS repeat-associated protein
MQAPIPNIAPTKQRPPQTTMEALGYDDTLSWAAQTTSGPDTNLAHYPRLMYYYHPDYLGHVEYITDLDGVPYQYCYYTAPMSRLPTSKPMAQRCFSADWSRPLARWGETLIEEKATRPGMHFDSPYRFNAKELDEESGLYYYGARYYNPMVSVWLGVDPLAHEFPSWTPYHFVHNNPVNMIDIDGRRADWFENENGDIVWYNRTDESFSNDKGTWTNVGENLNDVRRHLNIPDNVSISESDIEWIAIGGGQGGGGLLVPITVQLDAQISFDLTTNGFPGQLVDGVTSVTGLFMNVDLIVSTSNSIIFESMGGNFSFDKRWTASGFNSLVEGPPFSESSQSVIGSFNSYARGSSSVGLDLNYFQSNRGNGTIYINPAIKFKNSADGFKTGILTPSIERRITPSIDRRVKP